jgi:stage IV sporulation protein B
VLLFAALYVWNFSLIPSSITLLEGNEYKYNLVLPCAAEVDENNNVLSCGEDGRAFVMNSLEKGETSVKLKILGLVPVKSMHVNVVPDDPVIVCGTPIGIRMRTDGVMVSGLFTFSNSKGVLVSPAKDSGIKPGDVVVSINDSKITDGDELEGAILNSNGDALKVGIIRSGKNQTVSLKPAMDSDNDSFKSGMQIKDYAAGIGTMTFYDEKTDVYGALGHGISDPDSGALFSLLTGEVVEAKIFDVNKGMQGKPGELKGYFVDSDKNLGSVFANDETGIFGALTQGNFDNAGYKKMPIGASSSVHEGKALIVSTIGEEGPKEYEIEILKCSKNKVNDSKGLVIRIIDPVLLDKTGGIVQGMSGSPILQDGKLIGAVTHVMINDPTMGYGVFIEGMLNNINEQKISDAA